MKRFYELLSEYLNLRFFFYLTSTAFFMASSSFDLHRLVMESLAFLRIGSRRTDSFLLPVSELLYCIAKSDDLLLGVSVYVLGLVAAKIEFDSTDATLIIFLGLSCVKDSVKLSDFWIILSSMDGSNFSIELRTSFSTELSSSHCW